MKKLIVSASLLMMLVGCQKGIDTKSVTKDSLKTDTDKVSYSIGLDIGTTKIAVIVAQRAAEENGSGNIIDIIGIGTHPSRGLRRGVVINLEETVESIRHAVEEAELMAGSEISTVYAGIAGFIPISFKYLKWAIIAFLVVSNSL